MIKKVLFLYKTPRKQVYIDKKKGIGPDTILYGANHLEDFGFDLKIYDWAFSKFNPLLWLFYPVQLVAGKMTGIGFKLDQAVLLLPFMNKETIVISTMDTAGLPVLFLKKLGFIKSPVIYLSIQLAQSIGKQPNKFPFNWYKSLLKYADAIVCYSDYEKNILNSINKKTYFIPPGTDIGYYSKKAKLSIKKSAVPVILSFGWDTNRDYKTFINAVGKKKVKGIIVTAPENILGIKMPNNVKVYYNLPPSNLRELIFKSDIIVIPTKKVKWPAGQLSTLDALACGKPVIVPELPSLINTFNLKSNVNCLTYIPENSESLTKKLDILIADRTLSKRISKAGQKIANKYSTEIFASKLSDIISKFKVYEEP